MSQLTIAIAKGRLQSDALELLSRAGVSLNDESLSSRRLSAPATKMIKRSSIVSRQESMR